MATRQPCRYCEGRGYSLLVAGPRQARTTRELDCERCDAEGVIYVCGCGAHMTVAQRQACGPLCPTCAVVAAARVAALRARDQALLVAGARYLVHHLERQAANGALLEGIIHV